MADNENKDTRTIRIDNGGLVGMLWFTGWLFTLAYSNLVWWQAILAVAIWPYFLGLAAK